MKLVVVVVGSGGGGGMGGEEGETRARGGVGGAEGVVQEWVWDRGGRLERRWRGGQRGVASGG